MRLTLCVSHCACVCVCREVGFSKTSTTTTCAIRTHVCSVYRRLKASTVTYAYKCAGYSNTHTHMCAGYSRARVYVYKCR